MENQISKLEQQLNELKPLVEKEHEENDAKIKELLQKFTSFNLSVNPSIYWKYFHISVSFINEKGEEDFGSNFTLYFYKEGHYASCHKHNQIEINMGTIGSYSKEYIYQVERIKLLAKIWDNVEEVEKFFANLSYPLQQVYEEKTIELRTLKQQAEEEIRQQELSQIEKKLFVGQVVDFGDYTLEITKLTPKRIYHKYKNSYGGSYEKYDSKEIFLHRLFYNKDKYKLLKEAQ